MNEETGSVTELESEPDIELMRGMSHQGRFSHPMLPLQGAHHFPVEISGAPLCFIAGLWNTSIRSPKLRFKNN